jgi:Holliday junction resolvase RusA-like endonuclease
MKGGYEMRYTLIIAGRLDNMNDYTSACRTNQYKGAKLKQKNENVVKQAIYEQLGRLRIKNPVRMLYRWYEPNKRRDLDNISAFGRKVIQDALVDTRVLQDDGWRYVKGFQDEFYVDKGNPRIEVEIIEDE